MTISLVHQAALGDSILLLPLIRSLGLRFPETRITLVTRPNLGQMFTLRGFVDNYASADHRDHSLWFAPPEPPDRTLAPRPNSTPAWARADLLLSAVASQEDPWAANARLARAGLPPDSLVFFHPRPPADYPRHVTAWHREQLTSLDLPLPPLPLPTRNPDGALLIHPGSGGDAKCWPRQRFLALGHALKRNGIIPTFILGEAEQERWGRPLIQQLKDEFPWYLHLGLFELSERMACARLYLGNDSGVTHLAAALGIPTIALFGPSSDIQWAPVGPLVKILRAPPPRETSLEALEESAVLHALMAELAQS